MTLLGVAALSARMLAEAATDDGFEVVALDLFGDADTRRACSQWHSIGQPASMRIDADRLLTALGALARRDPAAGWIAGSGFEGRLDLLQRGAALLPLLGTPAGAMQRVRDPAIFFGFLDAEGIAHPPFQTTAPADAAAGWLIKDAHGCGGRHIRRVPTQPSEASQTALANPYFQREEPGAPMSATFIADGRDACVLGFNQQIVRCFGAHPFGYCGVVGPVPLPPGVASRVTAATRSLAREFALRGLGSMDLLLDGTSFSVLEVNPRPPASMALYSTRMFSQAPRDAARGIVEAHVRACRHGELPRWPTHPPRDAVAGCEIVFAPRPLQLDDAAAQRLAQRPGCHDLPAGATCFGAGDPVCSVSAGGANAEQVRSLLDRAREAVHQFLETAS